MIELDEGNGEVPALVHTEFIPRARALAEWAHRTPCRCTSNAPGFEKTIGTCVECLAILLGHAMTEAAVPADERERVMASGEALVDDPAKDRGGN